MRYVFTLFLGLILALQPAHAQPQNSAPSAQAREQIQNLLGEQPNEEEPQTISEFASRYFEDCKNRPDKVLTDEIQAQLCGCIATNMIDTMTLEEAMSMDSNTSNGEFQQSRMLMLAYTPCIESSAQAMLFKSCNEDTQNRYKMKNRGMMCDCVSKGVGEDLQRIAPNYIQLQMQQKSEEFDLLTALLDSDDFIRRSNYHNRKCHSRHERGR